MMMSMSACVCPGKVVCIKRHIHRRPTRNMHQHVQYSNQKKKKKMMLNDTLLLPLFNTIRVNWHTTQRRRLTINSASISHQDFNNLTRPPQPAINCKSLEQVGHYIYISYGSVCRRLVEDDYAKRDRQWSSGQQLTVRSLTKTSR